MLKAIIFDWHGVLDTTKLEELIHILSRMTHQSEGEVKKKLLVYERSYATGVCNPEAFWQHVQTAFHLSDTMLKQAKETILVVKPYEPLWKRLDQLRQHYTLAILSDCPADKLEVIKNSTDLNCFTTTHFSVEKKSLKDSDTFFLTLIKELGCKPNECLYVDDNAKHIATAKRLGLSTCHFGSIQDLDASLVALST